jgi:hypothetical protein
MSLSASPIDFEGVDLVRRSSVALDQVQTSRQSWAAEHRRPRALTAREALIALQFEATLVCVAAANVAAGVELQAEDFERLTVACGRIDAIVDEATA